MSYFHRCTGAAIYSSDEDDSDFETTRKKKVDKNKALRALAESDDESASGSDRGNRTASNNEEGDNVDSGDD